MRNNLDQLRASELEKIGAGIGKDPDFISASGYEQANLIRVRAKEALGIDPDMDIAGSRLEPIAMSDEAAAEYLYVLRSARDAHIIAVNGLVQAMMGLPSEAPEQLDETNPILPLEQIS